MKEVSPHGALSPFLARAAGARGLRVIRRTKLVSNLVTAHYLAQSVEQTWAFMLRELASRHMVASYRPRGGAVDVLLRHNTSDANILQEFTVARLYDAPAEVIAQMPAAPRVVDLGGHVGFFGAHVFAQFPDATLVSFEPDEQNLALLRETAAESGRPWTVLGAAAWTENTTLAFRSGEYAASRVDEDSAQRVEAVDVLPELASADFVKIDIEGSEWRLLGDPRFKTIGPRVLIVEWHPMGCPSDDPRAEIERLLHSAGYQTRPVAGAPPGAGMSWAWRPEVPVE